MSASTNRTMSTVNENQQYQPKSPYQFTSTNNYDYTSANTMQQIQQQQQQMNRTQTHSTVANTSQPQTNYTPYQNTRVQPFMLENNSLDVKQQQYNQMENWQMNNLPPSLPNNWNHTVGSNCYSPQQQQQQQQSNYIQPHQQFSIESPNQINSVQKTQQQPPPIFSNVTPMIHKQKHLAISTVPPINFNYSMNNNFVPKNLPPTSQLNHHLIQMHQFPHNASSFHQTYAQHPPQQPIQMQPFSQTVIRMPLKREYPKFPPGCIENVKPIAPLTKRKLSAKDLPDNDYSRWVMSLMSGLLAESTQALNGFSIVSSDDQAHNQIKLKNCPKLLPCLIQYFKLFLSDLFPNLFSVDANSSNVNESNKIESNNTNNNENKNENGIIERQEQLLIELNSNKNKNQENRPMLGELVDKWVNDEYKQNDTNDRNNFISTSLYPNKRTKIENSDDNQNNQNKNTSIVDTKPSLEIKNLSKINCFDDFENEAKITEVDTLYTISKYQEDNHQKCVCISTIIRNLSLISGNEIILSNNKELVYIIGKLLCYGHEHYEKKTKKEITIEQSDSNNVDLNMTVETSEQEIKTDDEKECLKNEDDNKEPWWLDSLNIIQENIFVTLTQMCACLNFTDDDEKLSYPILCGLLHYALCPSSIVEDNFKYTSIKSCSPKRLALECLAKLSINEGNVDLILSTPPLNHNAKSFSPIAQHLSRCEEQIVRELVLVLLHNFILSNHDVAIAICLSTNTIAELFNYLIQYEENLQSKETQFDELQSKEIQFQMDITPQNLTLAMANRAACCLKLLTAYQDNKPLFARQEHKLRQLTLSQNLKDSTLIKTLSEIVFELNISTPIDEQSDQPK